MADAEQTSLVINAREESNNVPNEHEIADITWADWCSSLKTGLSERSARDWGASFARLTSLCFFLYFFLFSLDVMGSSFKIVGGCDAGGLFNGVSNPIAGLMIGVLATVMVQSSSTSTSIVVAMVGAGQMDVNVAIPVIMGANIGTSVTNTIVSMGQINDVNQFKRAFSGATVHDMFNFLTVGTLLPIELIFHPLEKMTLEMVPAEVSKGEKWVGPIKVWVGPLVKLVLEPNKKLLEKISLGKATCEGAYPGGGIVKGGFLFDKADATLDSDISFGWLCLVFSLIFLCVCLFGLVKTLQSMVAGTSEVMMKKATNLNGYLAIVVGAGLTLLVQSSSITTSVLTPLVGLNILKLENMYPLTLGANIGTTCTALLASMVSSKTQAVQIALCHLFFNIFGILIWYPVPFLRRVPLALATKMGEATARYRFFPVLYIGFSFVLVPVVLLGISSLFTMTRAYQAIGTVVVVALVLAMGYGAFWFKYRGGQKSVLALLDSRQQRSDALGKLPVTLAEMTEQIKELQSQVSSLRESSANSREKDAIDYVSEEAQAAKENEVIV